MVLSVGSALLVVLATVGPVSTAAASDRTALVLGGTTVPTPDQNYLDAVRDHLVAPTHPNENIDYIPVTTPMEAWPITGAARVLWLSFGRQSGWGLDGPGWTNEPL